MKWTIECYFVVASCFATVALALRCQYCKNPSMSVDGDTYMMQLPVDGQGTTLMRFYGEVFGSVTNASCHQAASALPAVECDQGQTMCFAATKEGRLLSKGCMTPMSSQTLACWQPPRNDILNVTICTCQKDLCETEVVPLLDVDEDYPGLRTLNVGSAANASAVSGGTRLLPFGTGMIATGPSSCLTAWILVIFTTAVMLRLQSIKRIKTYTTSKETMCKETNMQMTRKRIPN